MKVLWIALVWPEPCSSAAGFRTVGLFQVLIEAGHELRVSSPCASNPFQAALEERGIPTVSLPPNDGKFDLFIQEYQPEVVIFDRFMIEEQFGWRVKRHVPAAVRILDTVDLHSLRRLREAKVRRGEDPMIIADQDLMNETAIRELSAIYRCDCTILVSRKEVDLLRDRYEVPGRFLSLVGFGYNPPTFELPSYEDRRDIMAIGNFNHAPNRDSFQILHREVWPRIRRCFAAKGETGFELHVYGAYPTREFMALDDPATGFRVRGPASDSIRTISAYRVNVAPLRFGAGIKGKVADGWAAGTPCVATPIAAEGMEMDGIFGGVVTRSWDEFALATCRIYEDRDLWEAAQKNGAQILQNLFNADTNARSFLSAITDALGERDTKRDLNPVGHMLWHHRCRSVEYFSRWIEAKNQLGRTREPGMVAKG